MTGLYELKGTERKEETTQKVECGEVITTTYYQDDRVVRVDKTVNVDATFMTNAFVRF